MGNCIETGIEALACGSFGGFGFAQVHGSSIAEKPYPCQNFSGLAQPMPLVGVYRSLEFLEHFFKKNGRIHDT